MSAVARPFNIIGWAQALYDFSARDMRELTLKEGDLVGIISKAGGHRGWWKGSVGEKVTRFRLLLWLYYRNLL